MPRFTLAILFGVLLAFFGNRPVDPLWSAYAPLLFWLARWVPRYRLVLLAAAASLWANALLDYQLEHRLDTADDFRVVRLVGRIVDLVDSDSGRLRFYLRVVELEGLAGRRPRLLLVHWYQDAEIPRPGESWRFEVRLKQPRSLLNPGGFDFARWMFSQGIDASASVRDSSVNRRLAQSTPWRIDHWRERLRRAIARHCVDCRQVGLLQALALGFRGDIDPATRQILRDTGTAHLLAISGLHVGLVALFAFHVTGLAWRALPHPGGGNRLRCATLAGLVAALGYAMLAGFSLPTQRALIMLAAGAMALISGHRVNLLQALCLALAPILLLDPRAVGAASFWLTASALGIIGFCLFRWPGAMPWWRRLLVMQLGFSLLLAPLGILLFDRLNGAGFAANLVAIPMVSLVVLPLILAGCALIAIDGWLAGQLLGLADLALGTMLDYLGWLAGFAHLGWSGYLPGALLALAIVALALALLPIGRLRAGAALALAPVFGWQPERPAMGEFEAWVLDVGQGSSLLLRTRYHSLVYDLGPGRPDSPGAAEFALLPSLRRARIERPDLVVVSHVDQDHSGGLHGFLRRYPASPLLSGTPLELRARMPGAGPIRDCHRVPSWRWDGVDFRFLADEFPAGSSNNRSCVLLVAGHHRLLLPGDIEATQESKLVKRLAGGLRADVLLAPHHGSATSSSVAFIDRVDPAVVVFTLAHRNRWGFPADRVLASYRDRGPRLYRSDRHGAIRLRSRPGGLDIKTLRNPPRRLWRQW